MILIICPAKRIANSISESFRYMSILSYSTTPAEALSEISNIYRAALIVNPESFPDIKDYMKRLRSYNSQLPIFAITQDQQFEVYNDLFDCTFTQSTMTPKLVERIIRFANDNHLAGIGSYHIGGFNLSCDIKGAEYFSTPVSLTKTELMILRFLSVTYPNPQKAADIVKYAFKSNRAPEITSIKTHISVMNKKIEQAIGKKMIGFVQGSGYIVLTPEYISKQKICK